MDGPLLPERSGEEEVQPRFIPRPEVLRVVAATLALIGAIVGLITRLEPSHHSTSLVQTVALPAVSEAFYGEPTISALRPATKLGDNSRRVCTDELRPKPRSGAWHCKSSVALPFDAIGVQAPDPGGPCTHRTTEGGSGKAWLCKTRIAIPQVALHMPYTVPVFFGVALRGNGIDEHRVAGVCWQQLRAGQHAPWKCGLGAWRPLLPSYRAVAPVDPGGPCVAREVDEETGVWWCYQRK